MQKLDLEKPAVLVAAGVTVPMASLVWLMAVPAMMSPATFAAMSLVAFGAAYVAFNTWRTIQSTENIGHVLQRTEATAGQSASAVDRRAQR